MNTVTSVAPVFIKDSDIGDPTMTPYEMSNAVITVTSSSKLEGVQKINGLWRIYVKDRVTRLELFCKEKLRVGSKFVNLYDKNPYSSQQQVSSGQRIPQAPQNNDKLTIRNLPLSVSNDEIKRMLEDNDVHLVSSIKYGCIRDPQGQLTSYKSGDRYVYVRAFSPPLPRHQKTGMFHCTLIHHGKEPCLACGEAGHRVGEPCCRAAPIQSILAFKAYTHPLSNHFPCKLRVYEKEFRSLEHAYFYYMATEFGKHDLAAQIQGCKHAGEVKKMSKEIHEDDVRWEWEKNNISVMKDLLLVKAQQCEQFRACLLENKDTLLAEATPSKLWASGLSPYVTENCAPSFWPGQNMLGALLTDLTQALLKENKDGDSADAEVSQDTVSQDTVAETVDEDMSTSKMETVSKKDENVADTHTTQHDDNTQCDTSAVHMSRPRNRCSPQSRPSRNVGISSSGSQRRGSHSKGARTPLRKATADQTRTPQQPISMYFGNVDSSANPENPENSTKRKGMASTPENVTECKSQR